MCSFRKVPLLFDFPRKLGHSLYLLLHNIFFGIVMCVGFTNETAFDCYKIEDYLCLETNDEGIKQVKWFRLLSSDLHNTQHRNNRTGLQKKLSSIIRISVGLIFRGIDVYMH
jgi:hypothetical protein